MRYLITGGAGFIGSHLAERLLEKNERVVLLDNLSTGSMENIRHLKGSKNLEYHLDGIENKQLLAELVDDADVIVHLAAAVGVKLIVESPVRTIQTNVNGTELVLQAASKKKKLVLLASTSEVYGKNIQVPFHEDADLVLGPTTKGRWSYAASKRSMSFWLFPIGKKRSYLLLSRASSIRWDRGKLAVTAWCCRISFSVPSKMNRSRSMAMESNRAVSAMCETLSRLS